MIVFGTRTNFITGHNVQHAVGQLNCRCCAVLIFIGARIRKLSYCYYTEVSIWELS